MLRKLHRCITGITLIVDVQPKVKHFNLEPFLFGPWEDTDICSESCRLLQTRTCEEVNPRSSCQDISPYRNGQTACHKDPCPGRGCGKWNVNFNVSIFLDLYTFGNWSNDEKAPCVHKKRKINQVYFIAQSWTSSAK